MRSVFVAVLIMVALAPLARAAEAASPVDLSQAVIVVTPGRPVLEKAAQMLGDEIFARTGIRLKSAASISPESRATIVVGVSGAVPSGAGQPPQGLTVPQKAEGYAIWVDAPSGGALKVFLTGHDDRGALFAAGRLLRLLHMEKGRLTLDANTRVAASPRYRLRGHQIGYRNTANSYDIWDVKQYEQYIRDMVVFGANSIELIPSLDPTEKDSPHMRETMWDMTRKLSELISSYGLEVWMWLPLDGDVTKPDVSSKELAARAALFKACPAIDGVFIPGGDPGDTAPKVLMPWLGQMAKVLHSAHPKAGVWVSNQGFTAEQNDDFFDYLRKRKPDWLAGVVFGPWVKLSFKAERDLTLAKYPIRRYPDICHTVRCQYPVPEWDPAFADTLGREPFNPRPRAYAHIHNIFASMACGFITYSDGVTDDVNKIVWNAMGWDPNADIEAVMKEYGRYFFGEEYADTVAKGLFAFEDNWKGPLAGNGNVEKTLDRWRSLEQKQDVRLLGNWRFQLALLRAYYDAYVRARLIQANENEKEALAALGQAPKNGVEAAVKAAQQALAKAETNPPAPELRKRIEELGEVLFKSIGMQLDVKRYKASGSERGAILEFLDEPLNDREWLEIEFSNVLAMNSAGQKDAALKRIETVVQWENPGAGGFYDDLGNAQKQPHLVHQANWAEDPGFVGSPQCEFSRGKGSRVSWGNQASTLFGTPLRMRYDGLDTNAQFKLRVTYAGRYNAKMKLVANGSVEIHGALAQPKPIEPVEFAIPKEATAGGKLDLEWQLVEGRGCQVAEVWLIKQ